VRVVQIGSQEFEDAKHELAGIFERGFNAKNAAEHITMTFVCDECGAEGQHMLRIEVGAKKHPHDLCAACLTKGLEMLSKDS